MKLDDALSQIAEIRQQMARTQVFRGYRAATTAFSAVMALVAAGVQRYLIGEATLVENYFAALWVWLAAAGASLAVVGTEMFVRFRRNHSPMQREMTLSAVEQFVPCLVAGAMLTYAIAEWAGGSLNMLPGLWCTLFGLGVMASRRVLPRGTFIVGAWYLLAGMLCIATRKDISFSVQMAVAFGGGQFLAAAVLYWTLERRAAGSI
ncbi:hypothetical protein [Humisphaera borealis]|uniref:Uncharacterized protein n=1 Tax=Humisphaera borealis TaxID=2807512 RepID=A0A7M2X1R7_9BACT|nr:hypothetical protein [Humisphaera borealis]QOV91081.1 hypothetical protein IPV69_06905 [Humisphaera borealis]